jgi:LacI family sucrose operon transcriptional repressor
MHQIGVIVPQLDSSSVSQMVNGIATVLQEHDYQFLLMRGGEESQELRSLQLLRHAKVAGIILLATVLTPKLKSTLDTLTIPVVIMGQQYSHATCVFQDDFHAMYDLTNLMLSRGRRQLGYIGVSERDQAVGRNRKRGMEQALLDAGLVPASVAQIRAEFSQESGYECCAKLLREHPQLDGILCACDVLAHGAIQAIRETGRSIPDDIALAGVDDSQVNEILSPSLTTIHLYFEESGAEAARLMMNLVESDTPSPNRQLMMGYELVRRDSL